MWLHTGPVNVSISIKLQSLTWLLKGTMLERHVIFQQPFFRSYVNLQGCKSPFVNSSFTMVIVESFCARKTCCPRTTLDSEHVLKCNWSSQKVSEVSWIIQGQRHSPICLESFFWKDPFLHSLPTVDARKSCSS